MKQTIKTITIGLFTLCTLGATNATFANAKNGTPAGFKFIGKINNKPVFQLNLDDASETYYITLKDQNNDIIYSERVKAKDVNFTRKYQLDITDDELNTPDFGVKVEVTSAKTHKTDVYKISSQRRVDESIIVAKL
jgi:hypothetical protein